MATATKKSRASREVPRRTAAESGSAAISFLGTLLVPPAALQLAPLEEPELAPPEVRRLSGIVDRRGERRCQCGHVLRVRVVGRHRVYFEPANEQLDDPVMNGTCPC